MFEHQLQRLDGPAKYTKTNRIQDADREDCPIYLQILGREGKRPSGQMGICLGTLSLSTESFG